MIFITPILLLFVLLVKQSLIEKNLGLELENTNKDPSDQSYSKHVWMYYDGDTPEMITVFLNRAKQILADRWELHVLDAASLPLYLDISAFPDTYHLYAAQAQSDLIRLRLLEKYGGWWIDASSIISSDLFMNRIRSQMIDTSADFHGYCYSQCPRMLIESGVLYAKKNSSVVRAWNSEYSQALSMGRESYIYSIFRQGIDLPMNLFKPYPYVNPYFTIYATERAALSRRISRKTSILITPANEEIYKLLNDCGWQTACGVDSLRKELNNPRYQITKIWSWWRKHAWPGSEAQTIITSKEPSMKLVGFKQVSRVQFAYTIWGMYNLTVLLMNMVEFMLILGTGVNSLKDNNSLYIQSKEKKM